LIDHIKQLHGKAGVHLISAMDDFPVIERGMKMIRTAHRMRESLLINLTDSQPREVTVVITPTSEIYVNNVEE